MEYLAASRLVGMLYGNILHRDSDKLDYQHYLDQLVADKLELKEVVAEFFSSEEFIDKFVVNQTPNELSANLLRCFFGQAIEGPEEVKRTALTLVNRGLQHVIQTLIGDPRYYEMNGQIGVPRYVEGRNRF